MVLIILNAVLHAIFEFGTDKEKVLHALRVYCDTMREGGATDIVRELGTLLLMLGEPGDE